MFASRLNHVRGTFSAIANVPSCLRPPTGLGLSAYTGGVPVPFLGFVGRSMLVLRPGTVQARRAPSARSFSRDGRPRGVPSLPVPGAPLIACSCLSVLGEQRLDVSYESRVAGVVGDCRGEGTSPPSSLACFGASRVDSLVLPISEGPRGPSARRRRGLNVVGEELRQIVVAVELVLVLDACERRGHGGRSATVRLSVRPAAWLCVRSRFWSERSSCSRRGAFVPRVKQGRGHCRPASRGSRRCGRFRRAAEGTRRVRRNGLGARHPATRPRARSSDRHRRPMRPS